MDPKFKKWVAIVCPDDSTEEKIVGSVDWNTVLTILIAIFQLISELGCISRTRASYSVKSILSHGLTLDTATLLGALLDELKRKYKK